MFFLRSLFCDFCNESIIGIDKDIYVVTVSLSCSNKEKNLERVFHQCCFDNFVTGDERFKNVLNTNIWNVPRCDVCKEVFFKEQDFCIYSIIAYWKKNIHFNDLGESYLGEPVFALDYCEDCFMAMAGPNFFGHYKCTRKDK